jgi:hypothetical protein
MHIKKKKTSFKDNMIYTLLLKCKKTELLLLTFYLFLFLRIIQFLHCALKAQKTKLSLINLIMTHGSSEKDIILLL